jgi:hypothetical protein
MTTETRTFVGQTGTQIFDGWRGFRIGQRYELTYTRELDTLFLQLPHAPGRTVEVRQEDFEKWFKK